MKTVISEPPRAKAPVRLHQRDAHILRLRQPDCDLESVNGRSHSPGSLPNGRSVPFSRYLVVGEGAVNVNIVLRRPGVVAINRLVPTAEAQRRGTTIEVLAFVDEVFVGGGPCPAGVDVSSQLFLFSGSQGTMSMLTAEGRLKHT
jgi:hypothetical protein